MNDEAEQELARRRLSAAIVSDSGEMFEQLQVENNRLRLAIRRLADQDATLSVCDGNVIVQIDATLTDAEREAVDKMRVHLYEISRDNAFIDEVCDDAKAACEAIAAFLERHK